MNKFFDRKVLLIAIAVIIALQFFLFIIYQHYNQHIEQNNLRSLLLQENMVFIQRFQAASEKSQQKMLKNPTVPNTIILLTANPKWPMQVTSSSLWTIYNKMKYQPDPIRISIFITKDKWLNVEILSSIENGYIQYLLISFEIIFTLFLAILLWIMYQQTVPLRVIAEAAKQLSTDLNVDPLQLKGPAITRYAFQAINEMQEKLKNLIQERTLMLAAISHDLRTPLTSMRLRGELIDDPTQRQKNHQDITEMETMISQILAFTKEDYLHEKKSKIDLLALVASICHDFSDSGHSVKFIAQENQRIVYHGSMISLKRAFSNLVDNAVKYGESVEVDLILNDKKLSLIVKDDGPGISEADRSRLFTPFYRVDVSRSRKKFGVGLGLVIARNIIHAHGGNIELTGNPPRGLQVVVTFPI